jgi:hypothetical protein
MFRYQESIQIAAPADLIYDIVADVTSTGDRSPECRRVEWLGEPARALTGAHFRGQNRWRGFTWSRNATITAADRGHEFAFKTEPGHGIYHDTTMWRYQFEPSADGGTSVTERYELSARGGSRSWTPCWAGPRHCGKAYTAPSST